MQTACEVPETEFVLGRPHENSQSVLDLSPDNKISRLHARVWKEDGLYWIEDRQSSRGTLLNNIEIKEKGKQKLQVGDVICAGETMLQVESLESQDTPAQTNYLETGASLPSDERQTTDHGIIDFAFDTANDEVAVVELETAITNTAKLEFCLEQSVRYKNLAELIPNADSWALALCDPQTDALLLKAYRCAHEPHVSETLARRAMSERKAFIWNRAVTGDISGTILQSAIITGMYAPLLWQDEVLGVICAESRSFEGNFRAGVEHAGILFGGDAAGVFGFAVISETSTNTRREIQPAEKGIG